MSNRYINMSQGTKFMGNLIMMLSVMALIIPFVSAATIFTTDSPNLIVRELRYDPYPLEAGKYVMLWIKIDNSGANKAENVTCTLVPKYPFSLDPTTQAEQNIGILPGMESAIIDYRIYVDANAVEGNNDLDIICRAGNNDATVERTINLYVTSKTPEFAIGSVSSQPTKLLPDTKNNQVKVKIQNIGTGGSELVTAKLLLPQGVSPSQSYSNIASLGTIAAGAVGEATFYIDADSALEPKVYSAQLEIYYRDSNNSRAEYKNQTLNVDINIRPTPIFVVEKTQTNPVKVSQGDKVVLLVTLRNAGFEQADSVSFKLYKQNDQPFTLDEKYDYIGSIKPNETGQAGLKLTVNSDAALKTHLLEGEIRYVVGNDVFVVDKQIPIQVVSSKSSGINPIYIAVALIVLVIIGIYYVGSRKKNK